jgi:hypothetical protein
MSVDLVVIAQHLHLRAERALINSPKELRNLITLARDALQRKLQGEDYGQMSSAWVRYI